MATKCARYDSAGYLGEIIHAEIEPKTNGYFECWNTTETIPEISKHAKRA